MKSFDEWFKEKHLSLSIHANAGFEKDLEVKNIAKSAFIAGQQSKQSEVDELQKRIDDALHEADESCGVSVDAFVKLNRILKGNTNDH